VLAKAYSPQAVEDRVYALWEESGTFRANAASDKPPFTISMPPPNATGELHLGHACFLTIEDIFIRFQRMRGKETLWLPGTDHASIATESVVIRQIQEELGIPDPRGSLGREELLTRIADYVEKSRGTIRAQIRKMGASCDWSRERYTLEPALNRCVNEVFAKMYRDGLIYRGHRIVNWDPRMQTTVSDDEIEWREEQASFYIFQYGPFQIGTARPETKFGDKYVVIHPDDERYAKYTHGEKLMVEWINGPVTATVIKDKAVDPTFGTGVMTMTPWHDAVDFEIAQRHGLDKEQIIGFDGKLLPIAGEFSGMRIEEARPKVVEKLKRKGLLVKIDEDYVHNKAVSYRGGGAIEPQIKEQWFIDVNKRVVRWKRRELSLKEVMQEVVRTKQIRLIPERCEKIYFQWIDNLRDWCISRQIWWGHRIPVWYRTGDGSIDIHVGAQPPQGEGWKQDPDTLDTWFSSGLWTWSTLVDPKLTEDPTLSLEELLLKSPDFLRFHPTTLMETGYDILFFWVARMILMTTYVTGGIPELEYGHVPFETVYLHGLVRTREGKKMSKSDPETMIDPLDIIPIYGADALRLSMVIGQTPGNDFRLYKEKIAGYRNFVNKLWNAARFILLQCEEFGVDPKDVGLGTKNVGTLSLVDRALLSALQEIIQKTTEDVEHYRLSPAGDRLYSFLWECFCDWYLELSKGSPNLPVLVTSFRTLLILLHPYIPFVTEELWGSFKPEGAGLLVRERWPHPDEGLRDCDAEKELGTLIDVIRSIRKLRTDHGVPASAKVEVTVRTHSTLLEAQRTHVERLGRVKKLTITTKAVKLHGAASAFTSHAEVYVHLEGVIDLEKERARLERERIDLKRYLTMLEAKLANGEFTRHAPEHVIHLEREKLVEVTEKLAKVEEQLQSLGGSAL